MNKLWCIPSKGIHPNKGRGTDCDQNINSLRFLRCRSGNGWKGSNYTGDTQEVKATGHSNIIDRVTQKVSDSIWNI